MLGPPGQVCRPPPDGQAGCVLEARAQHSLWDRAEVIAAPSCRMRCTPPSPHLGRNRTRADDSKDHPLRRARPIAHNARCAVLSALHASGARRVLFGHCAVQSVLYYLRVCVLPAWGSTQCCTYYLCVSACYLRGGSTRPQKVVFGGSDSKTCAQSMACPWPRFRSSVAESCAQPFC